MPINSLPTMSAIDHLLSNVDKNDVKRITEWMDNLDEEGRSQVFEKIDADIHEAKMQCRYADSHYKKAVYTALAREESNARGKTHSSEIAVAPSAGFYHIFDTDYRQEAIVFYDGTSFFLPGSEKPLRADEVNYQTNPVAGRYNLGKPIKTSTHWSVDKAMAD